MKNSIRKKIEWNKFLLNFKKKVNYLNKQITKKKFINSLNNLYNLYGN